jgi:hypothetical protein
METWAVVLVCVTSGLNVIAAIFTAFFKGYAEKKGENLATKEDLQDVVSQMKAVTQATKEIEAKFADQTSSRNRLLEMRREVAFAAAKCLGNFDNVLISSLAEASRIFNSGEREYTDRLRLEHGRYETITATLMELKGQIALVFDEPAPERSENIDRDGAEIIAITNEMNFKPAAARVFELRYLSDRAKLLASIREQLLA